MVYVADGKTTDKAHAVPDLDRLSRIFIDGFPAMNADEQKLALKLYALLAEGRPVAHEQLAQALDRPTIEIQKTLDAWPGVFYDDDHRVVGFWGIAVGGTQHRVEVNGKTVFTWCAWDTMFIPELLNATAKVTSTCAATGDAINLMISPNGTESVEPKEAVVSFLIPDEDELKQDVTTSFCHFVYFFRDRSAGEQWVAEHAGTFLLSIEDAFTVGKKMNAVRYMQTLKTLES